MLNPNTNYLVNTICFRLLVPSFSTNTVYDMEQKQDYSVAPTKNLTIVSNF